MNKKVIKLTACVVIAIVGLLLCACSGTPRYERLAPPQNLRVENGFLIWDKVEHAVGYAVYKGNDENLTDEARFDLSEFTETNTVYDLYVLALGDGDHYMDSEDVRFSYTYTPPEIVPTPGLSYKLLEGGGGYEVSRGLANLNGYIVIPDYYNGIPVTKIAAQGFWSEKLNQDATTGANCNKWTTGVRLPEMLEEIGESAFTHCIALTDIEIPESVVKIGKRAFHSCRSLKSINLPPFLTELSDGVFQSCHELDGLKLPSGLKRIGDEALLGAFALSSITIPDSVTEIGEGAFQACKSLTEIYIPDSVTKISDNMFNLCTQLAEIRFPNNIEFFGKGVVEYTKWLENQSDDFVTVQGYLCRYNGEVADGEEIVIPSHVKHISGEAFRFVKAVDVSVVIPDGVTIGAYAFYSFKGLKSVRLPSDLLSIPEGAFRGCNTLEGIDIPDSVTEIGDYAFGGCWAFSDVELPFGLRSIGKDIVSGCQNVTTLRIPETVTYCAEQVNSHYLKNIIISPSLIRSLSEKALTNLYRIKIFIMPTKERGADDLEDLFNSHPTLRYYLYVEEENDLPNDGGNYWHYAEDGKTPLIWGAEN